MNTNKWIEGMAAEKTELCDRAESNLISIAMLKNKWDELLYSLETDDVSPSQNHQLANKIHDNLNIGQKVALSFGEWWQVVECCINYAWKDWRRTGHKAPMDTGLDSKKKWTIGAMIDRCLVSHVLKPNLTIFDAEENWQKYQQDLYAARGWKYENPWVN